MNTHHMAGSLISSLYINPLNNPSIINPHFAGKESWGKERKEGKKEGREGGRKEGREGEKRRREGRNEGREGGKREGRRTYSWLHN